MRRRLPLIVAAAAPLAVAVGCFAFGEGILPERRSIFDAGPPPILHLDGAIATDPDAHLKPLPAHSVMSVEPAHGPFAGGQRAIVRGTGFASSVRVFFANAEVPADAVVPVDPEHVQVTVPAGPSGPADVATQNGDDDSTRTVLHDGYVYDPFYVEPASGPRAGGTVVTVRGDGSDWNDSTEILVDGEPCAILAVRVALGQPQEIDCRTPPGTPGAKSVRVVTASGGTDVLDAFVYADTDNGFRGGLSGQRLDGRLRIIVLNSFTGRALPGATVIVGDSVPGGSVRRADENGVVIVDAADLGPARTVTIAAPCFQPATFADVPVDTVTAYLDPILSPDCVDLNGQLTVIGRGGGSTRSEASIEGELVWPGSGEFQRGEWDVPVPPGTFDDAGADARRAAYVFELATDANQTFRLPAEGQAITPDSSGRIGYRFQMGTSVGNLTLYALAGVENRKANPPLFTAYTLGVQRGVAALPGQKTKEVYISMDIPLDHAVTLDVHGPKPTPIGPDRMEAKVGVRLGTLGYVLLPVGAQTALLPATAPFRFVGLPPLVKSLSGAEYVMTATAFTGENHAPPQSVIGLFGTTASEASRAIEGFLEVPKLEVPAPNGTWDGKRLVVSATPGGPAPDLIVFEIEAKNGLVRWVVTAPGTSRSVDLPALHLDPDVGDVSGPVTITVTFAKIDHFDYGALRYADLSTRTWDAYSTNVFHAHL